MKYSALLLLTILFLTGCKKNSNDPADDATFFKATLDGQTYPAPGAYQNWVNWDNGVFTSGIGTDTLRTVSTVWGVQDSTTVGRTIYLTPYPVLQIDLRREDDSSMVKLNPEQRFKELIKTGSVDYCGSTASTFCVSFSTRDLHNAPLLSTDMGDNTNSTFAITATGSHSVRLDNGLQRTSYSANFSCKIYDAQGNSQTLTGSFNGLVDY